MNFYILLSDEMYCSKLVDLIVNIFMYGMGMGFI